MKKPEITAADYDALTAAKADMNRQISAHERKVDGARNHLDELIRSLSPEEQKTRNRKIAAHTLPTHAQAVLWEELQSVLCERDTAYSAVGRPGRDWKNARGAVPNRFDGGVTDVNNIMEARVGRFDTETLSILAAGETVPSKPKSMPPRRHTQLTPPLRLLRPSASGANSCPLTTNTHPEGQTNMAIDIRSIQNIVAEVVADSPLPERLADLPPQLLAQVTAGAEAEGTSPDAYWREYRARRAKELSQAEAARTISLNSPIIPPKAPRTHRRRTKVICKRCAFTRNSFGGAPPPMWRLFRTAAAALGRDSPLPPARFSIAPATACREAPVFAGCRPSYTSRVGTPPQLIPVSVADRFHRRCGWVPRQDLLAEIG